MRLKLFQIQTHVILKLYPLCVEDGIYWVYLSQEKVYFSDVFCKQINISLSQKWVSNWTINHFRIFTLNKRKFSTLYMTTVKMNVLSKYKWIFCCIHSNERKFLLHFYLYIPLPLRCSKILWKIHILPPVHSSGVTHIYLLIQSIHINFYLQPTLQHYVHVTTVSHC